MDSDGRFLLHLVLHSFHVASKLFWNLLPSASSCSPPLLTIYVQCNARFLSTFCAQESRALLLSPQPTLSMMWPRPRRRPNGPKTTTVLTANFSMLLSMKSFWITTFEIEPCKQKCPNTKTRDKIREQSNIQDFQEFLKSQQVLDCQILHRCAWF